MQTSSCIRYSAFSIISLAISTILLSFVLGGCGTTMHLPSHWTEKKVVVDGKNTEWDRTYLIDDNKLVIGFVNDSSFVYVLLATNDRPLAMTMVRGLTVWFDAQGGNDKTFGIHYPMGGMFSHGGRSGAMGNDESSIEPNELLGLPPTELEILGPGKNDRHRMQIMETGGIQARYNITVNSFVYELRVPFAVGDQFPFAIHSKAGGVVGLGLETSQGKMQRKEQGAGERGSGMEAADERGDESEGGLGGMRGGGRGGERGGLGQGGSKESMGALDVWMRVQMVAKDSLAN